MKNENFSERLQSLRKEKDLTQDDMAAFLNVKRQTYGNYEKENGSRA